VTRFAIPLAAVTLVTGCFYTDPINQRPSIGIDPASSDPVFRGDNVQLFSVVDDPDGVQAEVQLTWHGYLCGDATDPATCDLDPAFYTSTNANAAFTVPILRADGVTQVTSVLVQLDAVDEGGASARPSQQLVIPIGDHPPVLDVRKVSRHGYVVGTPVDLFAKYSDPDDPLSAACVDPEPPASCVTVSWGPVVGPQVDSTSTLVDLAPDISDPLNLVVGKRFTPDNLPANIGEWRIPVVATDPDGVENDQLITIDVGKDQPPCIAEVAPIVPPAGTSLQISDPTLFSVPVVVDDLDVYPPNPSDPILGTATFSWTIVPPGGTRQPFGTGDSVDFDPSGFHAGDVVELRVEIFDRNNTPIPCAPTEPTCSLTSDPSCIQRQTWSVEVR
jgi:hypothetical protein